MLVFKIKENTTQSRAVIEMLKTFDFVEFQDNEPKKSLTTKKSEITALSKKINKAGTKKAFAELGIDYDSYSR
jgi:hypothetical protein